MITQVLTVTPEMAKQYLLKNSSNRNLSLRVVDKYSRDMINGKWLLSHQGIAFYADGTICDGQHRLNAIIKADVSIQIPVTFGVHQNAAKHVDTNRLRSVNDCLKIAGEEWANNTTISIIKFLARNACYNGDFVRMPSTDEVKNMYNASSASIEFASKLFATKIAKITNTSVLSAVAVAEQNGVNHKILERFAYVLNKGICHPEENAAMKLRDVLMTGKSRLRGEADRTNQFEMTLSAISHFMKNNEIKNLRTRKTEFNVENIYTCEGL